LYRVAIAVIVVSVLSGLFDKVFDNIEKFVGSEDSFYVAEQLFNILAESLLNK